MRKDLSADICNAAFAAFYSDIFLPERCADGVRAACGIAGPDVYPVGFAGAVAVVINTVCNVARNAAVLFAGFAGGFVCAEDIFVFKFHSVIFRIRKSSGNPFISHLCLFIGKYSLPEPERNMPAGIQKTKNFKKY